MEKKIILIGVLLLTVLLMIFEIADKNNKITELKEKNIQDQLFTKQKMALTYENFENENSLLKIADCDINQLLFSIDNAQSDQEYDLDPTINKSLYSKREFFNAPYSCQNETCIPYFRHLLVYTNCSIYYLNLTKLKFGE